MSLRGSLSYIWDVTKPLGQGATSMVYRGRNKSTGEEVAVKVFSQAGYMRPQDVQIREFEVMRKLNHKNIVPLLAAEDEQTTRNKVIVMQLTEHGSLYNMLEDPKNAYGLPEDEFLIVFEHVTTGMKYMKDSEIVHRDIKPGNILRYIGDDGRSIYKLTDFGAAKQLDNEEEQFMSLYGTEEYLHPDMYERAVLRTPNRKQFTSKVDLWSMGVTFFHVATGQLPFKPFGGRKNRHKMFEITSHKESGVIMGVQHIEGGQIEWSKELPKTCRLSDGLKLLITPIFARLLESNPSKVWNFEECFQTIESIIKMKVINVFCPHTFNSLKVYIHSEGNLTILQECIAEQTDIVAPSQLLIFDGQQLKDHVQALLPVSSYPKGITETNPIFIYNKSIEDFERFPVPFIKEFPRFSSNLTIDDYAIAKMCSAIACYIMKEVELYSLKQELMRRAVHMYIHELYHELGHLVDYHLFLDRNCQTVMFWKDNFLRTFRRELTMMSVLVSNSDSQLRPIVADLDQLNRSSESVIQELASQIDGLRDEVITHLSDLKNEQLQKKILKKLWNDSVGCLPDDRCVAKVQVVVEQIIKIKNQFSEDRKRSSLTFNEEQIHKYEKNKLSEICTKIKSLFYDHCLAGAKDQNLKYHSWFRMGWEVRRRCEVLDQRLTNLADRSEGFVEKLNTMCLQCNDSVSLHVQKIKEAMKDQPMKDFISLASNIASGKSSNEGSKDGGKRKRTQLCQTLLSSLEDFQTSFTEVKSGIQMNGSMLKKVSGELNSILSEDMNLSLNYQGPAAKKDF